MALTAAVAACSSAKGGQAYVPPSIATAPEQTTTTNPYAVPPTIDVAYVNRVLAGLDAAFGDILRQVVKDRAINRAVDDQLTALYTNKMQALTVITLEAEAGNGFRSFKDPPGDQRTTVARLITAERGCIFAQVNRDLSPLSQSPDSEAASQWVGLVPADPARDPSSVNPTPWIYSYEGFGPNHTPPVAPCAES
ncbi:MAG: hypothetical protein ABR511_03270 [Acidimicrobiales bacterium]